MKLAELQSGLLQGLTGSGDAAVQEDRWIDRAPGVRARLETYRELIVEVHLEALSKRYPVCAAVLGPEYWRQLLRQGWARPGSESPDLESYGLFIPELLRREIAARDELRGFGYLVELAELEQAVQEAQARTGVGRFDWAEFANLPEGRQAQARLIPSPALAKRILLQPVDEIWRRHNGSSPADADGEGPYVCCIHPAGRFQVGVSRWTLPITLLDRLLAGVSLAELETLASSEGVTRLHAWIEAGWIVGFTPRSETPAPG